MFYFHKVEYVQYLGEVDIFHTGVNKIYSYLQQCKKYKNRSMVTQNGHKCTATFLWFTVYMFNKATYLSSFYRTVLPICIFTLLFYVFNVRFCNKYRGFSTLASAQLETQTSCSADVVCCDNAVAEVREKR